MNPNLRTFIAVKIKPGAELLNLIRKCKNTLEGERIKWVEEDNLHLTLKFLGDTSGKQVEEIKKVLENVCSKSSVFAFTLEELGYFKSKGHPRVLFLEIIELEELKKLAKKLDDELVLAGFEKEQREFKPHLTLGRIKFLKDKKRFYQFVEDFKNTTFQKVNVSEIIFYQSILKQEGPEYIPLQIVPLNK